MGKIVITTNTSLDGVVQDPDGKEGFRLGGWFDQFGGEDLGRGPGTRRTRRWAPRPCCSAAAAMSGSPPGGPPGPASGRTS
jgi:hypothetical protein